MHKDRKNQNDYFTKYLAENASEQGFHRVHFDYTFLSNGVNAVCTLERYKGFELETFDQGFFARTIPEATEELSKFMSINYLGAEEKIVDQPISVRPSRFLMIADVHPRATKKDFFTLFQDVGILTTSSISYVKDTSQIYFFEFETKYDAEIVYKNYCGKELDGRRLNIEYIERMP